jgi:menaquinone-dependent protoporphyrinogen IX oxidase
VKGTVVYDSYYGNTRQVAEAIADELRAEGHEAEVRSIRERHSTEPDGDILFLGSPVRMGTVTGRAKRYVKNLDADHWGSRPLVVFTTTLHLPDDASEDKRQAQEKYDWAAGRKLRDLARSRGLLAVEQHLWAEVAGTKGPLTEEAIPKTKQFTRDVLESLDS